MKLKLICYECALPHMESGAIVHTHEPEEGNCHRCKRRIFGDRKEIIG